MRIRYFIYVIVLSVFLFCGCSKSRDVVVDESSVETTLLSEKDKIEKEFLMRYTHSLDMNHDGADEEIILQIMESEKNKYRYDYLLSINDVEHIEEQIVFDETDLEEPVKVIWPNSDTVALVINVRDGSYNDQSHIYFYDGEGLWNYYMMGRINSVETENNRVMVDTVVYHLERFSAVVPYVYYSYKSGEFTFQQTDEFVEYGYRAEPFAVSKEFEVYEEDTVTSRRFMMPVGTKFEVLGGDTKEWLLIQTQESGKQFWMHVNSGFLIDENGNYGEESFVGNYLEEVYIVN